MITTILFDIGDTLVRAAAPGTPVDELVPEPLEGVLPTLRALARSFRLGAVTDTAVMTDGDMRAALCGTGLSELLEVIVTSHDIGAPKPNPRGIESALERLDADPAATLFVGDADVDEEAAHAAGTAFARVGGGRTLAAAVRHALTDLVGPFEAARALVGPTDVAAERAALEHQGRLTKPPGALGRLRGISSRHW